MSQEIPLISGICIAASMANRGNNLFQWSVLKPMADGRGDNNIAHADLIQM